MWNLHRNLLLFKGEFDHSKTFQLLDEYIEIKKFKKRDKKIIDHFINQIIDDVSDENFTETINKKN
jgi:hypothetical protein